MKLSSPLARIQLPVESQAQIHQSEFHTIKYIKQDTTVTNPEVSDFNISYEFGTNPMGCPSTMIEVRDSRTFIVNSKK